MFRLILCGAVAGVLLGLVISSLSQDQSEPELGIIIVESAQPAAATDGSTQPQAIESLDDSERGLAQVWLIAFGAGAFFLLELISPLGIFYARSVPESTRTVSRGQRERSRRLGVPAS